MTDDPTKKAVDDLRIMAEGMAGKMRVLEAMQITSQIWPKICEKVGCDVPLLMIVPDPSLQTCMGAMVASQTVPDSRENMKKIAEIFLEIEASPDTQSFSVKKGEH